MGNRYRVLAYRGTVNLGDAIQAVAMSRLLPGELVAVDRDAAGKSFDPDAPFVVNGYLGDVFELPGDGNTIFAGVHVGYRNGSYHAWMKRSWNACGFRDFATASDCVTNGVAGQVVGCATMTLPAYSGTRGGEYSIDCDRGGTRLTQAIDCHASWPDQWAMALERLELLRGAALVHTSRLHVVLPCLAMGTPVAVYREDVAGVFQPIRMSILDTLGFRFDEPNEMDMGAWVGRFRGFLDAVLGVRTATHDPVMPEHHKS